MTLRNLLNECPPSGARTDQTPGVNVAGIVLGVALVTAAVGWLRFAEPYRDWLLRTFLAEVPGPPWENRWIRTRGYRYVLVWPGAVCLALGGLATIVAAVRA
jgi:hypothetical protein